MQRGGLSDVLALPALFADVDDPSPTALARLSACDPPPSCLVMSGGGYHAYWWLTEPLTDLTRARHLLRGLAAHVGGDRTSPAQSLRLVNSVNTKPTRAGAVCHLLTLTDRRYPASTFDRFCQPPKPPAVIDSPSRDLITAVTQRLVGRGCRQRGDWLNGPCPFPERHAHSDARPSFGFNLTSGCGHCFRCGTLPLSELVSVLLA